MSSEFQAALEARDLAALRQCPKADLHNHAILGGNRGFLEAWAGRSLPPLDRRLESMSEMHDWVGANFGELLSAPESRLKAIEATFVQAKIDGVTRLEVGDDVWAQTQFGGSAETMTEALRDLHAHAAPEVEWIPKLNMSRHCPVDAIIGWLEPFLSLGVFKTLDLSG